MGYYTDNICGIAVMKDGKTVYEDYHDGFGRNDTMHVASVTKSVMSLLTGIAIDKGLIRDTDVRVMDFFPEYVPKRGEKTIYEVRLYHLLTMTAPYKFRSEPWKKVCTSPDWTVAALDLLGGKKGLTGEFRYNTLGIQILGGIIENASGMKVLDFANEYLFKPLGIPEHRPYGIDTKEGQYEYLVSKSPRGDVWYDAPKGMVTSGWGLSLSPTDMMKIGQMCLDNGVYGDRIVSQDWIKTMTTPHVRDLGRSYGYMSFGYLWWIPDKDPDVFAAVGDGGNIIYVNRHKNIAAGITATFRPRVFDRIDFLENVILPQIP
ncbi:MAG: serine hydrolase [Oscillospiraceae bacterium]|nr:serine hydrolase [Oscillospiraceae bacterium]